MSVIWQEPMVAGQGPPLTKKRKDTLPEHRHTLAEWERMRDRIMELFEDNDLNDVAEILAEEGFEASVPQIRNRLKNWGHWKYLKLSEKQLRYIGSKLYERAEEGREKTAFRLGRKKIPSATLEKRFNDRQDLNIDEVGSIISGISSCNLSAYTSSTANGVRTNFNRRARSVVSLGSVPEDASVHTAASATGQSRRALYARLCEAEETLRMTSEVLADSQDELRREKESSQHKIEELQQKYNLLEADYMAIDTELEHSMRIQSRYQMLTDEVASIHAYYETIIDQKDDQIHQLQAQINSHICAQSSETLDEGITADAEEHTSPLHTPDPSKLNEESTEPLSTAETSENIITPEGNTRSEHISADGVISVSCKREVSNNELTTTLELFKLSFEGFKSSINGDIDRASMDIIERKFYALTDPNLFDTQESIRLPDRFRIINNVLVWKVVCVECDTTDIIRFPKARAFSVDNNGNCRRRSSSFSLWFSNYTRQHIRSPHHRANALHSMLGLKWQMTQHKPMSENKEDIEHRSRMANNKNEPIRGTEENKYRISYTGQSDFDCDEMPPRDELPLHDGLPPQESCRQYTPRPSVELSSGSDSDLDTDMDSDYESSATSASNTVPPSKFVKGLPPPKLITPAPSVEPEMDCSEQSTSPAPDDEQNQELNSNNQERGTILESLLHDFHDPMQYQIPSFPEVNNAAPTTENNDDDDDDVDMIQIDEVLHDSLWREGTTSPSSGHYAGFFKEANKELSTPDASNLKFTLPRLNLSGA